MKLNVDSGEKKSLVENFKKKCWEPGVSKFSKGLELFHRYLTS